MTLATPGCTLIVSPGLGAFGRRTWTGRTGSLSTGREARSAFAATARTPFSSGRNADGARQQPALARKAARGALNVAGDLPACAAVAFLQRDLALLAGERKQSAAFALADLLSRRGMERPCETLVA